MNITQEDKEKMIEVLTAHSPFGVSPLTPTQFRAQTKWGFQKIKAVYEALTIEGKVRVERVEGSWLNSAAIHIHIIAADKQAQIMAYIKEFSYAKTNELAALTGLANEQVNQILLHLHHARALNITFMSVEKIKPTTV